MKQNIVILLVFCWYTAVVDSFDDASEIRISTYHDTKDENELKCGVNHEIFIRENQPFYIYIEYAPIFRPSCSVSGSDKNVINKFVTEEAVPTYYVSKNYYTDYLKGKQNITCSFYTKKCLPNPHKCYYNYRDPYISNSSSYEDKGVSCTFAVSTVTNVTTEPMGTLLNHGVPQVETKFKANEGTYQFIDHSENWFTCKRITKGFLKLVYRRRGAEPISTGYQSKNYINWYLKLTPEDDGAVLECHIADVSMTYSTVLVLNLIYIIKPINAPSFEVNKLVLRPTYNNYNSISYYYYYDDELLDINILIDPGVDEDFKCKFNGELTSSDSKYEGKHYNFNYKIRFKTFYNNTLLTCSVKRNQTEMTFALIFLHDTNALIRGLSRANIEMMYAKEVFGDYTNQYIYEYDNNSTFTCQQSVWHYRRDEVTCPEQSNQEVKPDMCTFKFINDCNRTTIRCLSNYVHLIRTGNTFVPNSDPKTTTKNPVLASTTPSVVNSVTDSGETQPETAEGPVNIVIISVVVLLTTAVITGLVILRLHRKRKLKNSETLMNYASLPEHDDGPMPAPTQWDDNSLYAKPIPKSQRQSVQPIENSSTYANINDPFSKAGDEYANIRAVNLTSDSTFDNNDSCANVYSNMANGTYANVGAEPTYSEINAHIYNNQV